MSIGEFVTAQQSLVGRAIDRRRTAARQARRRAAASPWLVAASLIPVVLVLLVPTYLILRSLGAGQETIDTLSSLRTWQTLGNTVLLAVSVVTFSILISVPLAWLTSWTDLPGRRFWSVVVALPLVVPSYVAAYLYASILNPRGLLYQTIGPLLGVERLPTFYGFPGALFVLTLMSYPFVYLSVRAAMNRMDPSLTEAARSLGLSSRQAFWRVTLPYLRPSIAAGSLLVALYCLRDFGAVNLLQFGTFTRIIYNRYQAYRLDEAAAMSLLLVLLAMFILYLDHQSRGRGSYARLSSGCARSYPITSLGRWTLPALLFVGGIVTLALLVPAGGLLYWIGRGINQDWLVRDLGATQAAGSSFVALLRPAWNSVSASLLAALLTVGLALPITVLAVRYPSKLSHMTERLAYVSAALPGIVVALAYVFVGSNYAQPLYQTLPLMLVAYAVLFLPQAIGSERTSFMQIPPSLEEAGRSLGQRPLAVFRRVTLPLLRPGIMAAGAMVFLTCMKELPATLILSPIGFETLAADIWANISEAFFARAAVPTLLLILLSSVPLAIFTLRDGADRR